MLGWDPANIYLFKVNSKNTKRWSDVCPKLSISIVVIRSGVFIVDFENNFTFFQCFFS